MKQKLNLNFNLEHKYISDGCKLCEKGAKMVLFVTGICNFDCFYCPISTHRRKDVVYANEKKALSDEDVINEAKIMHALGTGITGGEPLLKLERVLHYINLLKSEFEEKHHIHLYTAIAPNKAILTALYDAGLDEIRFSPNKDLWGNIENSLFDTSVKDAIVLGLSVGIEVPALSGVSNLIPFIDKYNIFLNLNELEFSDVNADELHKRGFELKNEHSNAVMHSYEYAKELLWHKSVHFCSSEYKDGVQLKNRLIRIAKNTAREFDEITEDGTVIHGVIKFDDIECVLKMLKWLEVSNSLYEIKEGNCIDIAWWVLEDITEELKMDGVSLSIIERYPFKNGLVVESIPI
ncbi:MAG: radical SAM protein [Methanosarcinaceae archaeon]|nr:radical SAM protein [Methanosarcinaceae archaeon]NKQ39227.1 radical SAM protein [Methanosarcinales archaeon]